MTWAWFSAFMIVQLGISLWASRHIDDEADYFVAGRRLGTPMLALSLFATWFGAETCLGASGAVYDEGLSGARADPFGYTLCLVLMGVFLAARFAQGRFLTLGDLYRERYGVATERVAALVLLPTSLIWGAAQIRAFGEVLAATSNMSVDTAVMVCALLVVLYTFIGGLMGDIVTDIVQGVLLSAGLVLLLVLTLTTLHAEVDLSTTVTWSRLSLLPPGEPVWAQVDRWSVPILGSLVAQELIARVLAARTPTIARRASYVSALLYASIGAIPIVLGLLGPALVPGLDDAEQLLPTLAAKTLPHALYMLFSCSLMAAILSTIDSILLSISGLLSHNILVPAFSVESERTKLWMGRAVVVASGAIAYVIATRATTVYGLVETASAFGTAGILVTTFAALYWKRGDQRAAIAALVLGLIVTPIAEYGLGLPAPFLTTVGVTVVAYGLLALAAPPA